MLSLLQFDDSFAIGAIARCAGKFESEPKLTRLLRGACPCLRNSNRSATAISGIIEPAWANEHAMMKSKFVEEQIALALK